MNSSDYLRQMQRIAKEKRSQMEKRAKYREYLAKLNKLNGDFHPIIAQMRSAEADFANGGYVSGGKTLTSGKLLTQAEHLSEVQENLQTVIKGTEQEIENITMEINTLEANYQTAVANYNAALAEEAASASKK